MTEKRQTSQGYIIRILQHFATKLWNITNFVMLFQAVMKFLSRLVEIKILSITQVVNSAKLVQNMIKLSYCSSSVGRYLKLRGLTTRGVQGGHTAAEKCGICS